MRRALAAAAAALALGGCRTDPLVALRSARQGVVSLPPGVIEVEREITVATGASRLEIQGNGAILRASPRFRGRALLTLSGASDVKITGIVFDGNRAAIEQRAGLPPSDVPFSGFTTANGLLAENVSGLEVKRVQFRNIAGFAILAARSSRVRIEGVTVEDSGSRNPAGRNNTTGGILLEEGTADFEVRGCELRRIRGNGVWTHSLYTSPRNARGRIEANRFHTIGRDAIQVGHATEITVIGNSGKNVGFPVEDVDVEGKAYPVGIDTAGNVDQSLYVGNSFWDTNGKCIDLDGFHHGEVLRNNCISQRPREGLPLGNYGIVMNNTNPDMQSEQIRIAENWIVGANLGGIFVIGSGHRIKDNQLIDINRAHCNEEAARFGCYYAPDEPDMLRSGIYLGKGAERPAPAKGNHIVGNSISGWKMRERCIAAAPGVSLRENVIAGNTCSGE